MFDTFSDGLPFVPAVQGFVTAGLVVGVVHLLDRALDGPLGLGDRSRFVRLARSAVIAGSALASVAVMGILAVILYVLPYLLFFDPTASVGSLDGPPGGVILLILFCFFLCCWLWQKLFHTLPLLMHIMTRLFLGRGDIAAFPRLIDYAYYTMAAGGVSVAFLESTGPSRLSDADRLSYLLLLLLAVSLRFTKVTLERAPETYLDPTVRLRSLAGRVLWRVAPEPLAAETAGGIDARVRSERPMTRTLITSAIPYINGIKHLGNLIGSQLPADLYARYRRARGDEVMFICATDEHGTPAELAAAKAGEPVEDYCARMWTVQKELADGFRLSFDHFGRSSSPQNHALTQHFAGKLADAGLIEERSSRQVYSNADGRFLPDRYVEGTCPNCGYDRARGDQCENCTKQLDPTDLLEPRSAISGSTDLEVRETKHLFLLQSKMVEKLDAWIDTKSPVRVATTPVDRPEPDLFEGVDFANPTQRPWPILTISIAKKWLHDGDGLQDRGITRDLDWGVPVRRGDAPWPGMEGKVFYVWFDAPIEYIAGTAEWAEANGGDWERWWRTDKGADDVRYVQFMGKDNVPFHTLSFPATLLGSGEPWKTVDYLKAFNYLNYDGGQFSTSQGRGVFMDQALSILPPDYWRWWLLSHAPENGDTEFTWEVFQTDVNKDLADVLGNFVSRVTKFCRSKFGEVVPEGGEWGAREEALIARLETGLRAYEGHMDAIEIRKAAGELRALWVAGNEYLQDAAPWSTFKTDPDAAAAQVRLALNLIPFYATLSAPFIPDAAATMLAATDAPDAWPGDAATALTSLAPGHAFTVPDVMFAKITDDQRTEWAERFAGTRG